MLPINLRSFAQKVSKNKLAFKRYLGKIERNPPKGLHNTLVEIDKEVWQEIDCLSCANCCKKMTPTFTTKDITRIATYLQMGKAEFKDKWLYQENKKNGDWMNRKQPCQFLNLQTNMCSIYEVRPSDCAGFPHFTKKQPALYLYIHKQNIQYCPATYKMVEKMRERI